jgi:ribose/xylose/arabinose/galactoside ABC-type transport system permease subunit
VTAAGSGTRAGGAEGRELLAGIRGRLREHAALVALGLVLLIVSVFTATQSDVFLTVGNLRNILLQSSVLAIVACGMTLLMVSGGIDLSVGSLMSLAAVVAALLMREAIPVPIALLVGIAVAAVFGAINGTLAAWSPSHPFVVTLGMMILIQGIAISLTNGLPISGLDEGFVQLGIGRFLEIPVPILIAAGVAVLCAALLRFTVFGRRLYAMGGNELAAMLAGVRVRRTKVLLYALNGAVVGIAAMVLAARISSAQPLMGTGYELQAIAAVAVGGTPLAGGRGGIVGTLLGVLLLGVISNSLNLLGVSGAFQYVLQGGVIVAAVMSQRFR